MYGDSGRVDEFGLDDSDRVELGSEERVAVRKSLSRVRAATDDMLPELFMVEIDAHVTPTEQQYGVMVTPIAGRGVRADIDVASFEESGESDIGQFELSEEDCSAIATQLAASAVMQLAGSEESIDDAMPAS